MESQSYVLINLRNIDRVNIFSLTDKTTVQATPYKLNYHMIELTLHSLQDMVHAIKLFLSPTSLSNKIAFGKGKYKPKNFTIFLILLDEQDFSVTDAVPSEAKGANSVLHRKAHNQPLFRWAVTIGTVTKHTG